jgi:ribosome-associated toxin RatA of RatAB toxin-antitoxin module
MRARGAPACRDPLVRFSDGTGIGGRPAGRPGAGAGSGAGLKAIRPTTSTTPCGASGARLALRATRRCPATPVRPLGRDLVPHQAAVFAFPVASSSRCRACRAWALPLASAMSTLTSPPLKCRFSGTSVKPFCSTLPTRRLDLFLVHQQLLGAVGFGQHVGGRAAQRVDAAADQEQLTIADVHVAIGQLNLAGANGLDLPAGQHDAGLVLLFDGCTRSVRGGSRRCWTWCFGSWGHRALLQSPHCMKHVRKSVLLWYSPREMYDLVTGIAEYPQFLPWCSAAEVLEEHADGVTARLGLSATWASSTPSPRATITSAGRTGDRVPGQRAVLGAQGLVALSPAHRAARPRSKPACKVEFDLRYSFSSRALAAVVSPVFDRVANTFVESFVRRAEVIHGPR